MRRIPFDIIFTLLLGLGLGLAYSWLISLLRIVDADPIALRADFKDNYRSAVASSYAATGNLPRAQARLSLLGDANSIEALNSQAQRLIGSGEFTQADQIVALAIALEDGTTIIPVPTTPASESTVNPANTSTVTLPPSPQDIPFQFTETPQSIEETQTIDTPSVVNTTTPRPTRTLIPTVGVPFALIAHDARTSHLPAIGVEDEHL